MSPGLFEYEYPVALSKEDLINYSINLVNSLGFFLIDSELILSGLLNISLLTKLKPLSDYIVIIGITSYLD